MPYKDLEKAREAGRKSAKKNRANRTKNMRDWRAKNREKDREATRRWKTANPERALELSRAAEERRMSDPAKREQRLVYARAYAKKTREENPEQWLDSRLRYLYGITLEQRQLLEREQCGLCAICGKPETVKYKGKLMALSIDHCAKTKEVRGLLCARCNRGIGYLQHDIDLLRFAVGYLLHPPAREILKT